VADLEGAAPARPFSLEIYHKMLVTLKILDQKYLHFFAIERVGPPFEIAGSATEA
jgi:hypothetical protein